MEGFRASSGTAPPRLSVKVEPVSKAETRVQYAVYVAIAASSGVLLLAPLPPADLVLLVAVMAAAQLLIGSCVAGGRPRGARDYVRMSAYPAAGALPLLVFAALQLQAGDVGVAVLYVLGSVLLLGAGTAATLSFALFVARLPEVLRPGEVAHATVVGLARLDPQTDVAGVIATDDSLVIAGRRGSRARRFRELTLDGLSEVELLREGRVRSLRAVHADGTLEVLDVPVAQLLALANYLRARLEPA